MKKAYLTKVDGSYLLEFEGRLEDMGRRYPSKSRMSAKMQGALGEECQVIDRTGETESIVQAGDA
jgi:hypothetical protein